MPQPADPVRRLRRSRRDPRMNVVTVGYLAVLRDVGTIVAGTDAADASLVRCAEVLDGKSELAFDHLRIVSDAIDRVASTSR